MTGRWLKSMSYLMNAQKETSGIYASSHKPKKKYAMKMKEQKNDAHIKTFDGRKHFIRCI